MQERKGVITFQGKPLTSRGMDIKIGESALAVFLFLLKSMLVQNYKAKIL